MAKTKKKTKKYTPGTQYSKYNNLINKTPALRNIRTNLVNNLKDLRESIIEACFKEVDNIREELENALIYKDSNTINIFKILAKRNPDEYVALLRTSVLTEGENILGSVSGRFMSIIDDIEYNQIPIILKKASALRGSSVIETTIQFHDKILSSNLAILKHTLNEELDYICLEYLKSYTIPEDEDEEAIKKCMPAESNLNQAATDESELKNKDFKMRSYKELNSLAIEHGFTFARQRGDHAIYKNTNGYITVIPQRTIGKGLQIEILKQLRV